jgi:hypothetical protein
MKVRSMRMRNGKLLGARVVVLTLPALMHGRHLIWRARVA